MEKNNTQTFTDLIVKNPEAAIKGSIAVVAVAGFLVGKCIGLSFSHLLPRIGFFSTSQNNTGANMEFRDVKEAYDAFTRIIKKQQQDLLEIQSILIQAQGRADAVIDRMNQQLKTLQRFKAANKIVDSVNTQDKVVMSQQGSKLHDMFNNYPQLPNRNLTVLEIEEVQRLRMEHHEVLIQLFVDYMHGKANEMERLSSEHANEGVAVKLTPEK